MEKIRLGRTEMMVSKIGFGGIPIQRVSEDEAIAVVRRCLELGINFLDTANGYTTSEERIGKAIAGQRERLILATKSQARTREELESHIKLSLKRLGVEYIDLYQFHQVRDADDLKIILSSSGPRAVVDEAKRAGIVKHIGITTHQMDVAKEAIKSGCFETIMFPFNFIRFEAANELLPLAREHDVGFIAMKPLAGGVIDNAKPAFKYLLQFPEAVPIPGIRTVQETDEIIQIAEGTRVITAADKKEMERIKQEAGPRFCRRCDYCQPCKEGIEISTVMTFPIFNRNIPPERFFSGTFAQTYEKAANCIECGECEEKCPYNLPIREMLAEHVKLYEAAKKKYQEQVSRDS
ncbi:aldo/keto reductase [Chloroflexota bacterium]